MPPTFVAISNTLNAVHHPLRQLIHTFTPAQDFGSGVRPVRQSRQSLRLPHRCLRRGQALEDAKVPLAQGFTLSGLNSVGNRRAEVEGEALPSLNGSVASGSGLAAFCPVQSAPSACM